MNLLHITFISLEHFKKAHSSTKHNEINPHSFWALPSWLSYPPCVSVCVCVYDSKRGHETLWLTGSLSSIKVQSWALALVFLTVPNTTRTLENKAEKLSSTLTPQYGKSRDLRPGRTEKNTSKHINTQQFKNMNSLNGEKKETHITETIKY